MTQEEILEKVLYHAKLRGLSESTAFGYWSTARRFQNHFGKPADELDISHVQDYLHYLLVDRKCSGASVNRINSDLRFLFGRALGMPLDLDKIPMQKKSRKIPNILTKEDVRKLIDACDNLRDKTILMTVYGAGLRVGDLAGLKVADIDSRNMQIFIRKGKGDRQRFALLSQVNLDVLREYWLAYRPKEWLFYSRNRRPMCVRSIQDVFNKAKRLAGITKPATIHTLRHSFATHLLEDGIGIYHIKQLLGHVNIATTCIYLHLVKIRDLDVQSPLDSVYPGNINA